jgi:purine nucleoside phosphorylase
MLGIIGGSGLTQLANLDVSHREVVRTPYGEPSGPLSFGRIGCRMSCSLPATATATRFRRIW